MKKEIFRLLLIPLVFMLATCDYKDTEVTPDDNFVVILDSIQSFGTNYTPLDFIETTEEDLIILSRLGDDIFKPINIIKTDNEGAITWEISDSSDFTNPLPLLIHDNGETYFIAMNKISLNAHVLKLNEDNLEVESTQEITDFPYPLATAKVPGGYILMGFDRIARRTQLVKLSESFQEIWREKYNVFENPPEFDQHLSGAQTIPFYAGYVGTESSASYYYFHGFNNQRLSLTFVNPSNGEAHKSVEGHRYEAGVSSIGHLSGNNFFLSKYNTTGQNSVLSSTTIDLGTSTVMNSQNEDDIPDNYVYELPDRTPFVNKRVRIDGKTVFASATNTNSNRVRLSLHNASSGALLHRKYFGDFNPYQAGSLGITSSGRFVLLTSVKIQGRFSRIALFKLSPDETKALVN